ncbi:MAG: recombinase family protein [Lachnospiraceae bacterium]|nr:recombinase family protein [Lachnospiraceae bacterium]
MDSCFYAAAYIRLSREDGDKAESDSIGNQKKLIREYIKEKTDISLYDLYIDDGFTGTNFHRPAFERMLADIEEKRVNCVIVKDLSRFGRDYIDTGRYLERYFPERNIRFISITDGIDNMKQAYDMLLPIKNIFNEQYARDISRKVHSSMEAKQKAGEFIGAFPSYGYRKSPGDKNKLVVDEYAADIVRRIFSLYIGGMGKNGIAAILNREGIVCPSEYKKLQGENYRNSRRHTTTSYWTYSTVNRILQNEMYIGNMVQGRKKQHMRGRQRTVAKEDWIVVKDTHPAIIDQGTWEKTKSLLKHRTRKLDFGTNTAVFAGFLKCGDCGRAMARKNNCYYCGTYVRSGRQFCTPHALSYEVLESAVLEDLQRVVAGAGDLKEIIRKACGEVKRESVSPNGEKESYEIALQRIKRLKQGLYEDYREGLISKEEYKAYRQDYLVKEEQLSKMKAVLKMKQKEEKNITSVFGKIWINSLLEHHRIEYLDRNVVVEMLHEIRIYKDHRIEIIYNLAYE